MKNEQSKIRSRYTDHIATYTEAGRPMHNNYQIRINENGHKELYKIGEHNLQAEINAAAGECDIKTMLERLKGGDVEALNKAKAGYVDLTKCPKDLREAQDIVLNLKNEFNTLPIDIRRSFDHSPEKYIAEYGTNKWANIMGINNKIEEKTEVITKEKEEVKVNE